MIKGGWYIQSNGVTGSLQLNTNASALYSNGITAATISFTNGNGTFSGSVTGASFTLPTLNNTAFLNTDAGGKIQAGSTIPATSIASGIAGISISGTAAKATADGSGNTITTTYATQTQMTYPTNSPTLLQAALSGSSGLPITNNTTGTAIARQTFLAASGSMTMSSDVPYYMPISGNGLSASLYGETVTMSRPGTWTNMVISYNTIAALGSGTNITIFLETNAPPNNPVTTSFCTVLTPSTYYATSGSLTLHTPAYTEVQYALTNNYGALPAKYWSVSIDFIPDNP